MRMKSALKSWLMEQGIRFPEQLDPDFRSRRQLLGLAWAGFRDGYHNLITALFGCYFTNNWRMNAMDIDNLLDRKKED